ncbi:MAG: hypothetical protein ACI4L6_01440 [Candidatus Onthoplasma sp.]
MGPLVPNLYINYLNIKYAFIAQLDRALVYGTAFVCSLVLLELTKFVHSLDD